MNYKRPAGGITIHDLNFQQRAIVIKIEWYLHERRNDDQWIRLKTKTKIHTTMGS